MSEHSEAAGERDERRAGESATSDSEWIWDEESRTLIRVDG